MLSDSAVNEACNAEGVSGMHILVLVLFPEIYFHLNEPFLYHKNTAIWALPKTTCVCVWSRTMCGLCGGRCLLTICYQVKFQTFYCGIYFIVIYLPMLTAT